jgi:PEP-CTERM motif
VIASPIPLSHTFGTINMKSIHSLSAAIGLVAALSSGTAMAVPTPLFNFDSETLYSTPSFGTTGGVAIVEDGSLTGSPPMAPRTQQLLLDSQGTGDFSAVKGTYTVPALTAAVSYFQYGFSVAAVTTFQFTYNFLTSLDRTGNDFFVGAIFDAADAQTNLFAESAGTSALFASGSAYLYETGTKYVEFTVGAGSYTAEFLLGTDQQGCLGGGTCIPSGALLNSVPEPTTLALVALALVGAVSSRARPKATALVA